MPSDVHTAYEPEFWFIAAMLRHEAQRRLKPYPRRRGALPDDAPSRRQCQADSAKLIGYFKLASVAHYLVLDVIDPDARIVIHYNRNAVAKELSSGPLRLDPPGMDLTVEDLLGPA